MHSCAVGVVLNVSAVPQFDRASKIGARSRCDRPEIIDGFLYACFTGVSFGINLNQSIPEGSGNGIDLSMWGNLWGTAPKWKNYRVDSIY